MVHIEEILLNALAQKGDRYILGAEASLLDPDPDVFDCSELVEWSCGRAGLIPKMPDLAYAQAAHCRNHGTGIPVATAITTRGALLFMDHGPTGSGGQGNHVAFSLGDGTTIEARGKRWGVGCWTARARSWNFAALIPGADYRPITVPWPLPPRNEVTPMYIPALQQITCSCQGPGGIGALAVGIDGSFYNLHAPVTAPAGWVLGPNGQSYWENRIPASIEVTDTGWKITATTGEDYHYPHAPGV